jgi:pyruvate/2-oxoacid:ferredoxin oxidoreductase beta subunit
MVNVNRAIAPPWSIYADQTDSVAQRDTGWIQLYCTNSQEVLDGVIQAYRVCEAVGLPAMLNLDAFYLSHTSEPVDIPDQAEVDAYLPPLDPRFQLDPERPQAFGGLAGPEAYLEARETAGADLVLLTMGTLAGTAAAALPVLRQMGRRVGLVRALVLGALAGLGGRDVRPEGIAEAAGAVATGVRAGLELRGLDDVTVMAWAGDGGTFDIGLQALSGAAERDEDFLYVCYDNEAYMNTGIQRSSATPWGAWTTTALGARPKLTRKKDIVAILAAHRIPYAATASVAFPGDLEAKLRRALAVRGTRFLQVLSPCPPGWRADPDQTIRLARLAVEARVFPLYEVRDGREYHLTHEPRGVPVADYLRRQGRFAPLGPEDVERIQAAVDADWQALVARCGGHARASPVRCR